MRLKIADRELAPEQRASLLEESRRAIADGRPPQHPGFNPDGSLRDWREAEGVGEQPQPAGRPGTVTARSLKAPDLIEFPSPAGPIWLAPWKAREDAELWRRAAGIDSGVDPEAPDEVQAKQLQAFDLAMQAHQVAIIAYQTNERHDLNRCFSAADAPAILAAWDPHVIREIVRVSEEAGGGRPKREQELLAFFGSAASVLSTLLQQCDTGSLSPSGLKSILSGLQSSVQQWRRSIALGSGSPPGRGG